MLITDRLEHMHMMNVARRPAAKWFLPLIIAIGLAAATAAPASASMESASTPAAVAVVPAQPAPAAAPAVFAATSTTKSCGTGGYSYQTDSMYVVRSWTGSSWKYVITRSANRTTYDSNYHSYTHSGKNLFVYWSSSSMSTYSFPSSTTVYSSSSGVDFRGTFTISVDGGVHVYTTMCDVYF